MASQKGQRHGRTSTVGWPRQSLVAADVSLGRFPTAGRSEDRVGAGER